MLPPDRSPVHQVVLAALALGPITPSLRGRHSHATWRAALWTAAAVEQERLAHACTPYNPSDDGRVRWMLQWCDCMEGARRTIDDRLDATMRFLCHFAPPLTPQHLAAGDFLETLTLAQGS